MLTLDNHLVTGNQYLLAIACLCILEYGGSGLGSRCCIGHGQSLKALDSVCAIISQLNGPTLRDCNCVFDEQKNQRRVDRVSKILTIPIPTMVMFKQSLTV